MGGIHSNSWAGLGGASFQGHFLYERLALRVDICSKKFTALHVTMKKVSVSGHTSKYALIVSVRRKLPTHCSMDNPTTALIGLGILCSLFYCTAFEWFMHRYIMHRRVTGLQFAFVRHTRTHHRLIEGDHTYHVSDPEIEKHIRMPLWAGPLVIGITQIPVCLVTYFSQQWVFQGTSVIFCALYFTAYEYLHYCMHLPKARRVEKGRVFRLLNGHHILHHWCMGKNFNVVCPLMDLLMGTLVVRPTRRFTQPPVGGPVPDLQPRNPQSKPA